jgi:hypothetical protein
VTIRRYPPPWEKPFYPDPPFENNRDPWPLASKTWSSAALRLENVYRMPPCVSEITAVSSPRFENNAIRGLSPAKQPPFPGIRMENKVIRGPSHGK